MFENIFYAIILVGIAIIAWFTLLKNRFSIFKSDKTSIESKTILNRMEKVFKLVLTEGVFNEIIDSSNTDKKFFGLITSTKKSLLIVEAKVLVGFDFSKAKIEINNPGKTIQIVSGLQAEIISLETDFKFYDVSSGLFNKFKPEDYNTVLNAAKEHIKLKVENSEIVVAAQNQLNVLLEQITSESGYQLIKLKELQS